MLKIVCKSYKKILNYSIVYNYSNILNIKKYILFVFYLKQKKSRLQLVINLVFTYLNIVNNINI